jgi:hypothetical protein
MNSMPAASNARRTAISFAAVSEVSFSVSSARRIVVTLKAVARERSSALQRMSARAGRITEEAINETFQRLTERIEASSV